MKENDNTRKDMYKMDRKNMVGESTRACTFGAKIERNINFFKF